MRTRRLPVITLLLMPLATVACKPEGSQAPAADGSARDTSAAPHRTPPPQSAHAGSESPAGTALGRGPSPKPAPTSAAPPPEDDDLSEVMRKVRMLVRTGIAPREDMLEYLLDELRATDPVEVERATAALDMEIARKAEDERTWPAVLDTDRLDEVFEALEEQGVLCLHDAGYTQSDGFHDAEEVREEGGGDASNFDAYCFYHRQDVERAACGEGLYLASGSFRTKEGDASVSKKIVAQLKKAGFQVEWDGNANLRVCIQNFDFRRHGIPEE